MSWILFYLQTVFVCFLALGENVTILNQAQRVYFLHSEYFRQESHIPFSGTF